jgi:hypothetical protein
MLLFQKPYHNDDHHHHHHQQQQGGLSQSCTNDGVALRSTAVPSTEPLHAGSDTGVGAAVQSSICHGASGRNESVQGGAAQQVPHLIRDLENGLQQTQGASAVNGATSQHEAADVVDQATSTSHDQYHGQHEGAGCIHEEEIHMYERRFVARLGREGNVFSPQYVGLTAGFHHPELLKRLL